MPIDIKFIQDTTQILTAMRFLQAVEDSDYTYKHSIRVGRLVKHMAIDLGLDKDKISLVTRAAYFHDVGKIKLPDEIVFKQDFLTDDEYKVIQKHTEYGRDIVKGMGLVEEAEIVIQHHERLDGSGYPNGLKGDEFNGLAQIIAVADVYDAIIAERPYKEALTPEQALLYMYSRAEVDFHLFIVKSLHRVLENDPQLKNLQKTLDI